MSLIFIFLFIGKENSIELQKGAAFLPEKQT